MVHDYAQFNDLPLELLPVVVQHLLRPSHLATACLVNKAFYTFAVPLLYERVFISAWHKEGKAKVSSDFNAGRQTRIDETSRPPRFLNCDRQICNHWQLFTILHPLVSVPFSGL